MSETQPPGGTPLASEQLALAETKPSTPAIKVLYGRCHLSLGDRWRIIQTPLTISALLALPGVCFAWFDLPGKTLVIIFSASQLALILLLSYWAQAGDIFGALTLTPRYLVTEDDIIYFAQVTRVTRLPDALTLRTALTQINLYRDEFADHDPDEATG